MNKMNKKAIILGATVLTISGLMLGTTAAQAYQGDQSQKGTDCDPERHEAMEEAFENNDYNAWKELMSGKGRVTQVINESNFARFAEAHELEEQGKIEEANQIKAELGLGLGSGSHEGQGQKNNQSGNRGNNR